MPDLEPVKIQIRQFDEHINEIKINSRNDQNQIEDENNGGSKYMRKTLLVSPHSALKQFTYHLVTLCLRWVPEASSAKNATILLVNKDERIQH